MPPSLSTSAIPHNPSDWERVKSALEIGQRAKCTVTSHHQFGVLVMLEITPVWGVIERIGLGKDGYITPDEYPPVGKTIDAIVVGFREYSKQIELKLEPRPAAKGTTLEASNLL